MNRLLALGLAWAVVLLAPSGAFAWNSIGHLVVAKLAFDQLVSLADHPSTRILQKFAWTRWGTDPSAVSS